MSNIHVPTISWGQGRVTHLATSYVDFLVPLVEHAQDAAVGNFLRDFLNIRCVEYCIVHLHQGSSAGVKLL